MFNDLPHRYVHQIAVSPTYGEDRTVFAVASVPAAGYVGCLRSGPAVRRDARLFRSTDAGESWQMVEAVGGVCTVHVGLAMSPDFARDGTVLFSNTPGTGGPTSRGCYLARSDTRGETWDPVRMHHGACFAPQFMGDRTRFAVVYGYGSLWRIWQISRNGGRSWREFLPRPPQGNPAGELALAASPSFATDGTIFLGWANDLWRYAPARRPDGSPGCPVEVAAEFHQVWQRHPVLQEHLDCPFEPARQTRFHFRSLGRDLVDDNPVIGVPDLEGTDRVSFTLRANGRFDMPLPGTAPLEGDPGSDDPGSEAGGVVQAFENGWLLRTSRGDGSPMVIALVLETRSYGGRGVWQLYGD
jgi:hypothetical protein